MYGLLSGAGCQNDPLLGYRDQRSSILADLVVCLVQLDPQAADAHLGLARAYELLGDVARSESHRRQFQSLRPQQ